MQVRSFGKRRPIPLVVPDVVYVGGRCAHATPGTFPAKRLVEQLGWPEIIGPYRQAIPAVPRDGLSPTGLLRPVFGAPAVLGQFRTPWTTAWAQWFARHGLSPPQSEQNKKPEPTTAHTCVSHWLWLLKLWPLLISTLNSRLQVRQYATTCVATVAGSMRITRRFLRQNGHTSQPSSTGKILPHFSLLCNGSALLSTHRFDY